MIRQFLSGCHILGAITLAAIALLGVVALASLINRAFGRKP